MIVSFRWTTEPLLTGHKTVTRREWSDDHAEKFQTGTIIQAYDKSPRNGGIQVATLIVKSVTNESTISMTKEDYRKEGFAYLYGKYGIDDASPAAFEAWRRADILLWVCRFEVINSTPVGEWLERRSPVATPMNLPGVSA